MAPAIVRLFTVLGLLVSAVVGQSGSPDYTCGPDKPCASGCCGVSGYCGLGPTFCGSGNCTSGCSSLSECDPGWGSQYSANEKCPLNVCCSKYGFCGTNDEFCDAGDTVQAPSCSGTSATGRTVGYYEGWSSTRACDGVFPEALPVSGYTHINYAFAYVDPNNFGLTQMAIGDVDLWDRLNALRDLNPGLQIWLSVGGWSMNDADQPTARAFSEMASSQANREAFGTSLLSIMQAGFDGVDIDWEYPVAPERSGDKDDYANYPEFLDYLRNLFRASGFNYGISITIPSSYYYMQNFDIVAIEPSIDWFNIMTYDLHGTWDTNDTWTGPYVQAHTNLTEIDQALDLLWRNNIDPAKVTLGLGFYGRSFTLKDPSCKSPGCVFSGGGNPGPCTGTVGILSYDEITDIINGGGAQVTYYQDAAVEVVTFDNDQWVSYDDAKTLAQKIDYANSHCIGGTMVWAMDLDKSGAAIDALSGSTQQQKRSAQAPSLSDSVTQCQWTNCINFDQTCPGLGGPKSGPCVQDCPSGSTTAWVSGGPDVCDGNDQRRFCCPNDAQTTCRVADETPFFCSGRCKGDEVKIGSSTSNCLIGSDDICCTRSNSVIAQEQCSWSTTCQLAPDCPNDKPNRITSSPFGDGGFTCLNNEVKALCCSDPNPYTNCNWNRGPYGGYACQGLCDQGQTIVAISTEYCSSGDQVLCCDGASNDAAVLQFELTLATFVANPSCPANQYVTTFSGDLAPGPVDEDADYKRDVALAERDVALAERDLGSLGFDAIDQFVSIFYGGSNRAMQMRNSFDRLLGPKNLNSSEYLALFDANPEYDPSTLTLSYLCDYDQARTDIIDSNQVAAEVCEVPFVNTTTSSHSKRTFFSNLRTTRPTTGGNSAINTGALLDAILNTNTVPFLYARLLRYNNRPRGGGAPYVQANLEVVYDLRNRQDLQQTPGQDIFAVFHFHTDSLEPDPANPSVPLYPNIPFVHVFHGQVVYNANPNDPTNPAEWRVDYGRPRALMGAGGANERAVILRCPHTETWYPGHQQRNNLELFGALLRAQGIMAAQTYHNWDDAAFRWDFQAGRVDWPNTGLQNPQGGATQAPADMRPNNRGGSQGWPT